MKKYENKIESLEKKVARLEKKIEKKDEEIKVAKEQTDKFYDALIESDNNHFKTFDSVLKIGIDIENALDENKYTKGILKAIEKHNNKVIASNGEKLPPFDYKSSFLDMDVEDKVDMIVQQVGIR